MKKRTREPLSFFIYKHGHAPNDVGIKVGYGRFVLNGKDVSRLVPAIITVTSRGGLRIRRPRHCPKGWPDVTRRRKKVSARRSQAGR